MAEIKPYRSTPIFDQDTLLRRFDVATTRRKACGE